MSGVTIAWKRSAEDEKPSRLNVLAPGTREPDKGTHDVVISDAVLWSLPDDRDPDEGRSYWACYQSPAGDWW